LCCETVQNVLLIPPKGGTPLFHRSAPPILGISQSSTCFLLNPDLIFEIDSNLNMTGNMILSKSRVVNRVNLIQTLNKESNVVQRLIVDLKALVFVSNIFLLTKLLQGDIFLNCGYFESRQFQCKIISNLFNFSLKTLQNRQ
jgi:hypothetical protein